MAGRLSFYDASEVLASFRKSGVMNEPMMVQINIVWPSGNETSLTVPRSSTVGELKALARQSLKTCFLKLVTAEGHPLSDMRQPLEAAGLGNGDILTAIAHQQPVQIQATDSAFAAILADGSVVCWGHANRGGDSSCVNRKLRGVQQIQATDSAFAAILADGSVVCWGHENRGGDSSCVNRKLRGVQQIQATDSAFAAILADGSVVCWGDEIRGGDSSCVNRALIVRGAQQIQATDSAFAAILADGSVLCWGHENRGGDSSYMNRKLRGVQQIQATDSAFAAILADGSVVCWGHENRGGDNFGVKRKFSHLSDKISSIILWCCI